MRMKHKNSLSLVEVLVVTAVVTLGLIGVSQGLLAAAGASRTAQDRLSIQLWMDSKYWEMYDQLMHYRTLLTDETEGTFMMNNKTFTWKLAYNLIQGSEEASLYELTLYVSWKEGFREAGAVRSTYALYVNESD